MSTTQILESYSAHAPLLQRGFEVIERSLQKLIVENKIKVHSLSGRIKARSSLKQKISRPDRNYENLWQVTDLIGFRVITYSEDVIEKVAQVIENAFDMDLENSVNKLRHEDHQRFGYRSLHYVCELPASALESELTSPLKFEIQIRTNLQHTWAEFEHDLGYKINNELPGHLRRRFSQIASLLEVADRELVAVHAEIKDYERELKTFDLAATDQVELDQLSLPLILQHRAIVDLDRRIAQVLCKDLNSETFYPDYLVRVLHAAGFKHLSAILDEIPRHKQALEPFVRSYFDFSQRHWNFGNTAVTDIKKGYGLLFLAHLSLLARENLMIDKLQSLTRFYEQIDYPNDHDKAKSAAQALLAELKTDRLIGD